MFCKHKGTEWEKVYFYSTEPHRSLLLNLRLRPGLSGSYPYTVNHGVCVCARARVCAHKWIRGQVWQADLHVLPERVCGPVLPVITWTAWSPGAPAWPGHWAARNNRDWQEGNEGSHGGREEGGQKGDRDIWQQDWWKDEGGRVRRRRELYCGEESCEDNDVGASGSIKEQRKEDKRRGRYGRWPLFSLHITFSSLWRELKIMRKGSEGGEEKKKIRPLLCSALSLCVTPSNQKNKPRFFNKTDHLVSLPICFEAQFIFESMMSERSRWAATRLQRWNSWIHLGRLGQQLKCWIKSDCILCPEEALPAILRGLINMAAVGCAEHCHRQLKNNGDIISLNVLYLEWRRFYNHYCDGPQAAGCAKGKGWMKITLFLTRPLCVFLISHYTWGVWAAGFH